MTIGNVWFSHREKIYEVNEGRFSWTDKKKIWNWDNCTVSFARTFEQKLRVVVRSNAKINSKYLGDHLFTWTRIPDDVEEINELRQYLKDDYNISPAEITDIIKTHQDKIIMSYAGDKKAEIILEENYENARLKFSGGATYDLQVKIENDNIDIYRGKPVELRYMLGFEVDFEKIQEPQEQCYIVRNPGQKEGPKLRYVLQLDEDHWVWEWTKEGGKLKDSYINEMYRSIQEEISSNSRGSSNIFDVKVKDNDNRIIPVLYQPAVDALENFIREIHCAQTEKKDGSLEIEVTLIFNNEQLRINFFLQRAYKWLRENILYGRKQDIESFLIQVDKDSKNFVFKNIYSKINGKEFGLKSDSTHGDKKDAPKRNIKYFFMNEKHPIIFINTSNHAMAENDANHMLWKWEYIPWLENSAVIFGNDSLKQIDERIEEKRQKSKSISR